jgi:hypothetical protein
MINKLKIVSGGQTGVDRAALDFAMENHIECGGWCPKNRIAEDGTINEKYPLMETDTTDSSERTYRNVKDSDGTIVFVKNKIDEGTGLTIDFAEQMNKPLYIVHLTMNIEDQEAGVFNWFVENNIKTLNIAGAKESFCPGIYIETKEFLNKFLTMIIIRKN